MLPHRSVMHERCANYTQEGEGLQPLHDVVAAGMDGCGQRVGAVLLGAEDLQLDERRIEVASALRTQHSYLQLGAGKADVSRVCVMTTQSNTFGSLSNACSRRPSNERMYSGLSRYLRVGSCNGTSNVARAYPVKPFRANMAWLAAIPTHGVWKLSATDCARCDHSSRCWPAHLDADLPHKEG